jgi:predicted NAD/FAD-dependent oxidoreductase
MPKVSRRLAVVLTTAVVNMAITLAGWAVRPARSRAYRTLDTAVLATPTPRKITACRANRCPQIRPAAASVVTAEAFPVHLTNQ